MHTKLSSGAPFNNHQFKADKDTNDKRLLCPFSVLEPLHKLFDISCLHIKETYVEHIQNTINMKIVWFKTSSEILLSRPLPAAGSDSQIVNLSKGVFIMNRHNVKHHSAAALFQLT